MKTLRMLTFLFAGTLVLYSCEDLTYETSINESQNVTLPFEADFVATLVPESSTTCLGNGEGKGTCFKDLKCHLMRCSNQLTGECEFKPDSYLLDASGDKLFISGKAVASNLAGNSADTQTWNANFTFNGGTGRFDGVTGSGNWEGCFRKLSASGTENCFSSSMLGIITIPNAKLKEFTDTESGSLLW
jgi:hypothetical protein